MIIKLIDITSSKEVAEVRSIWEDSFTDNEEFLNRFFQDCFPYIKTYGLKTSSSAKIVSVASLIDIVSLDISKYKQIDSCKNNIIPKEFNLEIKDNQIGYLYGVATSPDGRGLGYSKFLINEIVKRSKEDGVKLLITRPATESLFSLYKSIGFHVELYRKRESSIIEISPSKLKRHNTPINKDSKNIIKDIHERVSDGKILSFNENVLKYALEDIRKSGGIITSQPGFSGNYQIFHKLTSKEFFVEDSDLIDMEKEGECISTHLNKANNDAEDTVHIKIHRYLSTKEKAGIKEKYALAYPLLAEAEEIELPHLNFLME